MSFSKYKKVHNVGRSSSLYDLHVDHLTAQLHLGIVNTVFTRVKSPTGLLKKIEVVCQGCLPRQIPIHLSSLLDARESIVTVSTVE